MSFFLLEITYIHTFLITKLAKSPHCQGQVEKVPNFCWFCTLAGYVVSTDLDRQLKWLLVNTLAAFNRS